MRGGGLHKIRERVRAARDFGGIEDALGEAGEKAARAVFGDVAARTEYGGARSEFTRERQQIVFIAASAVEQEQGRGSGIRAGLENVMVGKGHARIT